MRGHTSRDDLQFYVRIKKINADKFGLNLSNIMTDKRLSKQILL
jgi:hypothetical protein